MFHQIVARCWPGIFTRHNGSKNICSLSKAHLINDPRQARYYALDSHAPDARRDPGMAHQTHLAHNISRIPQPCNDPMHVTTCWIAVYRMPAGNQEWRTRHASHTPSRALPLPFKLRSEVPTIQIDLSYNLRCQGQQTFEAGERICATPCLQALLCRMRAQASPATPQPPAMRESSAPSF